MHNSLIIGGAPLIDRCARPRSPKAKRDLIPAAPAFATPCILPAILAGFYCPTRECVPSKELSTESDPNSTILFRNGPVFVAFCRVIAVAAVIMAGLMALYVIVPLSPLAGINFARALQAFCWALAAYSVASFCPYLWAYSSRLGFYHVQLDPHGVEFLFGTKTNPNPVRIAWDQVRAIQHKHIAGAHEYTVLAKDGSSARFSSNTFFHTKKIAQLIAARAHLSIEDL